MLRSGSAKITFLASFNLSFLSTLKVFSINHLILIYLKKTMLQNEIVDIYVLAISHITIFSELLN